MSHDPCHAAKLVKGQPLLHPMKAMDSDSFHQTQSSILTLTHYQSNNTTNIAWRQLHWPSRHPSGSLDNIQCVASTTGAAGVAGSGGAAETAGGSTEVRGVAEAAAASKNVLTHMATSRN